MALSSSAPRRHTAITPPPASAASARVALPSSISPDPPSAPIATTIAATITAAAITIAAAVATAAIAATAIATTIAAATAIVTITTAGAAVAATAIVVSLATAAVVAVSVADGTPAAVFTAPPTATAAAVLAAVAATAVATAVAATITITAIAAAAAATVAAVVAAVAVVVVRRLPLAQQAQPLSVDMAIQRLVRLIEPPLLQRKKLLRAAHRAATHEQQPRRPDEYDAHGFEAELERSLTRVPGCGAQASVGHAGLLAQQARAHLVPEIDADKQAARQGQTSVVAYECRSIRVSWDRAHERSWGLQSTGTGTGR